MIGRNLIDVGNLVGHGETTLLAEIAKLDPIYVYFDLPDKLVATDLERRGGLASRTEAGDRPTVLVTVDGSDRVYEGTLDYVHLEADTGTGTVEVRGIIPNPDKRLLPGFFARVRLPGAEEPGALLVPETALSADLGGRYLLVVGDDNVVERRYTELGELQDDGMRVIRDGIAEGERFIIEGLQRARPGLPVTPKNAAEAG